MEHETEIAVVKRASMLAIQGGLLFSFLFATGSAVAEAVSVKALMTPQEEMKFDLGDGSNHVVLAVRREGKADGSGMFAGASVVEFGWHDINPPFSSDPRGYLQLTAENGDVAILSWTVRAVFLAGDDGPVLLDNGIWELVSGTGQFDGLRGVGSLTIKSAGGPNRLFVLDGEVQPTP